MSFPRSTKGGLARQPGPPSFLGTRVFSSFPESSHFPHKQLVVTFRHFLTSPVWYTIQPQRLVDSVEFRAFITSMQCALPTKASIAA